MTTNFQEFSVISTFAGCGGSSLGYIMAGGKIKVAIEWEPKATKIYKSNHKNTTVIEGDIAEVTLEQLFRITKLAPGELDLLDGSPPCQGFSRCGTRKLEDPRNSLFKEYVRLLQGLQPKTFVMENVPALVQGKMKLIFAEIMTQLKNCGYEVAAKILNAQNYGVPQSRSRIFFIGIRKDIAGKLKIKPTHPTPTHAKQSARSALVGLPEETEEKQRLKELVLGSAPYEFWDMMKPGQNKTKLGLKNGFNTVKLNPTRPAPTITKTASKPRYSGYMHWSEKRPFTTAELQRFSGFPDTFSVGTDYESAVERLGNTVPPPLTFAIASHLNKTVFMRLK